MSFSSGGEIEIWAGILCSLTNDLTVEIPEYLVCFLVLNVIGGHFSSKGKRLASSGLCNQD